MVCPLKWTTCAIDIGYQPETNSGPMEWRHLTFYWLVSDAWIYHVLHGETGLCRKMFPYLLNSKLSQLKLESTLHRITVNGQFGGKLAQVCFKGIAQVCFKGICWQTLEYKAVTEIRLWFRHKREVKNGFDISVRDICIIFSTHNFDSGCS